ncbi:MAG: cupin domain-containing protein [Steroidobacter sp.]
MNACIRSSLLAIAIAIAAMVPPASGAAEPSAAASKQPAQAIKRTILRRVDVPNSNYEVVLVLVEVPADTSVGRHTHPGTVVGYVIEGEYTMLIDGKAPQALRTGESLEVPGGVVHDERTGDKPAKLLAAFTVEKGKPLAVAVPD